MTTATETTRRKRQRPLRRGAAGPALRRREAARTAAPVESRRARGLCGHRLPGLLDGLLALKPDTEINSSPTWFSTSPTLDHFRDAINRAYFWDAVKNSLIIVGVTVVLSIVLAFLAAIALAKYRFTGRSLFVVAMIGILMPAGRARHPALRRAREVPPDERRPEESTDRRDHHLHDLSAPLRVRTRRGFLLGIPKSLEGSAMVDGSSRLGAFLGSSPSSHPAWSRLRCSSSSQPGTSTSSPTFF